VRRLSLLLRRLSLRQKPKSQSPLEDDGGEVQFVWQTGEAA
jgi:hypothetical protein